MTERRLACLFCANTYLNPDTIISHCRRDHHPELDSVSAVYGTKCPDCGKDYSRLSQHSSVAHRLLIPLLFAEAARAGDPHGVVAERRRHLQELLVVSGAAQTIPLSAGDVQILTRLAFAWNVTPQEALRRSLDAQVDALASVPPQEDGSALR